MDEPSAVSAARREYLVRGLVGPGHDEPGGLYETSASFRAAIDTLSAMLPAWVDGLARQAEEHDRGMSAQRSALAERLTTEFAVPPELAEKIQRVVPRRR